MDDDATWMYQEGRERGRRDAEKRISELEDKLRSMSSAASDAAASTVMALDRLIEMEKVVKAAEGWVQGGSHAELVDAVRHWQQLKKGWS